MSWLDMTPAEFSQKFMPYAERVSQRTGLDSRLVLAQAALETGYGRSAPKNNYFGIKSHGKPGGSNLMTKEFEGGRMVSKPQSFRGYADPSQSFEGYADFILSNPRYKEVLGQSGLSNQIAAMGESGYATDPKYASKLRSIANRFGADMPNQPIQPATTSTQGTAPMMQQKEKPRGILEMFGVQKMDPEAQGETALPFYQRPTFSNLMGDLALGFNSMRLRPDEGLAKRIGDRRQQAQTNRSIEYLSQQPGSEPFIEYINAGMSVPAALQAYQAAVTGGKDPTAIRSLRMQAADAGLTPGTPEYQEFMLYEGGLPSNFRALDLQAKAAGYEPGTPDYERFMASRGAFEKTAQTAQATAETAQAQQLSEMTRNLPGLYDIVDELSALADVATYTAAGRAADELAKQTGQPMSEGGKARAAYIATVDNQILPLLRQTFGAAFTAEEGNRLRATLGDENASPEQKKATLDAFIRQKQREVVALGGSLPERPAPTAQAPADAAPTRLRFNPETGEFE